ncbi:hypothetical protein [Bartonella sp. A05]|uniref:hypothetical protein n=1 Tax=Bartonella sp. A05 TaxID=2967261 RepID=UPI0022A9A9DF|nr:hypothetical protein [Bartonella sp. A05]MCZ2203724.1 hypothetical protein [Bartonella sp. A05]
MVIFPFSIADIDDPKHIRVVLYASGCMGHAPLNALFDPIRKGMHQDMRCEDKRHNQNYAQLLQRIIVLEEKLKAVIDDNRGTKDDDDNRDNNRKIENGDKANGAC